MGNERTVDNPDYKGPDRRNNGRLRLSFSDWRWVVIGLFGIAAWLSRMELLVKNHDEELRNAPPQVTQEKVENIEEDVGEIKEDIDEIQTEQRVMRQEMNDGFMEVLREIKNNRHGP